ncbi:extracellular solute-binding protein [Halosimplex amylolyticum]|uniref:extracellular solute-binding protein n=1 Tax=Halosimplex amylolyticum TaxID=3396616 RepID=UPI003F54FDEC
MVDSDSRGSDRGGKSSITRRRMVKAIGATGAAGLAGCSGGGDGGDGDGGSTSSTPMGTTGDELGGTVTIYSGQNHKDNFDNQVLHDAGVPDSIDIKHTTGPQATGGKQQKLKIALDSEARDPDLVMTDNGWTIPFIVRGDLVNLEEEMDDEFIQNVKDKGVQSMVETGQHPETGDLYSIPAFPDFPAIEYRKDLLRNVGYTDEDFSTWQTDPPTWAEFSSIVAEAHAEADVDYGHLWQGNNYVGLSCCTFNEFLTSMGGAFFGGPDNLFGPIGDRPVTIGEEKAVDGIELARDLIHGEGESPMDVEGVSPQEVAGWIEPDTLTQFAEEANSVALRNWTYAIGQSASAFEGSDAELGVMPLPKGPNGSWHAQGGWVLSMNPHSDNKEAAKEVLKAWFNDEVYKHQLDSTGLLPGKADVFSYVEEHETYGPYFEALSYSGENMIPRPTTSVWPNQREVISSEVNAAIRKEKSAQDAADAMQEQIKAIEEQASG